MYICSRLSNQYEGGTMRNPEAREGRAWLSWAIDLSYGKALQELTPKDREATLKKFAEFCNPKTPRPGRLLTVVFRWVIPGQTLPAPTVAQVNAFRDRARDLVEQRLSGAKECLTGIGVSANYQADLVSFQSPDPVDAAMSRLGYFLSANWKYIRRCPRWTYYPKEWCRRVFVLKKLPDDPAALSYCSHRCRQRVHKREAQQIATNRYGIRGPKPQAGG
jgi:hypothetical protein